MNLFTELRRRNVFRVCGTYVVAAWFLVQTAFTLEGVMNLPDWFDGLVMAVAMMGLPVVAVLAWAFELTPDGFKRTEVVAAEQSIAAETGRKLDIAILGGLLLVGGLLIFDRVKPGHNGPSVAGRSVAVLPFENRSTAESDAFFADGMHDELLTTLSRIPGLDVISRTSVMGYRDTDKRVPDIARELGVSAVLEGAVQRSGERVRITVQLIDGQDDRHIWAESYDRPLSPETIFDIQGEITDVIATSLRGVFKPDADAAPQAVRTVATQNQSAYDAYLKARLLTRPGENNPGELKAAIAAYDRALEEDPDYAQAWAGKAYAHLALYWFGAREADQREAARLALERAEALDPDALETHISRAFYLYWGQSDYRAAAERFDAALEVAPGNVDAVAGQAFLIRRLGDFEGALPGLQRAHRLDPGSYYLVPELALSHALLGQFDAAERFMAKARDMDPASLQGHGFAAAIAQFRGDHDAAFEAFKPLANFAPYDYANYALATQQPDKVRAALAVWPDAQKTTPAQRTQFALAQMRAAELTELAVEDRQRYRTQLDALYDPTAMWEDYGPMDKPVLVAALLGRLDEVERLAATHEVRTRDDAFGALALYGDFIEAFARLGETDRALDYVERMAALTTPAILRVLERDPLYAPLRETERWQALSPRS